MSAENPATIRTLMFFGGVLFFLIFELLVPYRLSTVSKLKRWVINLALTGFNTILLNLAFTALVVQTLSYVATRQQGILNIFNLSIGLKALITVVFMDFMLYVWHLLNHEIPVLWRFHRVHHSDLNMDVITATRFHFGELAISAVIKIGIIFLIGADFLSVLVFESTVVLAAQFEHSSLKVPGWFESLFWILFVPPSMHRIHHSVIVKDRNTNYGTIFSIWDRVCGTLLSKVDQSSIRIGIGAYQREASLNFHHLLVMPFKPFVK
jgi:sterol desaturase/sphingolipid hydroxylase (fatty acid hydroxylase superfamily)